MPPNQRQSRAQITIAHKQEGLRLLGARPDGSFWQPEVNPETSRSWSAQAVEDKYGASKPAVLAWKKRAREIFSLTVDSRASKRVVRIVKGNFKELETALAVYMRSRMAYMNDSSLFRADIISARSLDIKDKLLATWREEIDLEELSDERKSELENKIQAYDKFKSSSGWAYNFMRRNNFHSAKGGGQEGFVDQQRLYTERYTLRQALCTFDIGSICNTDEVALLYRALPRRSFRDSTKPASYSLIKDRLTAVLTVYADGRKAPLTIIGKSICPRSFPRHFDGARDLGIFYKAQENAWNTQHIWAQMVAGFNKRSRLQHRKIANVLENCSAHVIDYGKYECFVSVKLPPNMTSTLQHVDAAVGRSFKCAFRRLMSQHILAYVEENLQLEPHLRKPFKMNEAITTFDAVKLMKAAWDLVPMSVVLKAWLKTDIIAPYQRRKVLDLLDNCGGMVRAAEKAFEQSASRTEVETRERAAEKAKKDGEEWLKVVVDEVMNDAEPSVIQPDAAFDEKNRKELHADIEDLSKLDVLEDFTEEDLDSFFDDEDGLNVCRPISEETAVEDAVCDALEELSAAQDGHIATADDAIEDDSLHGPSDAEIQPVETPSVSRLEAAITALQREISVMKRCEHPMASRLQDGLEFVLDQQVHELKRYKKLTRRQSTISDFFKSKN